MRNILSRKSLCQAEIIGGAGHRIRLCTRGSRITYRQRRGHGICLGARGSLHKPNLKRGQKEILDTFVEASLRQCCTALSPGRFSGPWGYHNSYPEHNKDVRGPER